MELMEPFTVWGVAAYLKTGRQQVRQMIRRGQLRAAHTPGRNDTLTVADPTS